MTRIRGDLRERTFEFACRIVDIADEFPNRPKGWVVSKQLVRSGTSIGSNIREADNALTDAEFAHRCSIARKEAAETYYWLELSVMTQLIPSDLGTKLMIESDELAKILSTVVQKTQTHLNKSKPQANHKSDNSDQENRYQSA